jgi:hypothetical protein
VRSVDRLCGGLYLNILGASSTRSASAASVTEACSTILYALISRHICEDVFESCYYPVVRSALSQLCDLFLGGHLVSTCAKHLPYLHSAKAFFTVVRSTRRIWARRCISCSSASRTDTRLMLAVCMTSGVLGRRGVTFSAVLHARRVEHAIMYEHLHCYSCAQKCSLPLQSTCSAYLSSRRS